MLQQCPPYNYYVLIKTFNKIKGKNNWEISSVNQLIKHLGKDFTLRRRPTKTNLTNQEMFLFGLDIISHFQKHFYRIMRSINNFEIFSPKSSVLCYVIKRL
jgi:hypothetical protein